jgi:hypothetical protein
VDQFVESLSGMDAAGVGAGLADALIGAFVDPMKAAELLGDMLLLGVQKMGNELIYQVQYWSSVLLNTLNTVGVQIIPMLGSNMLGAFTMAVGGLGEMLLNTIANALKGLEPIAGMFGLSSELQTAITTLEGLAASSHKLMVEGAATIENSANTFRVAFASAQSSSTVVRQDFTGAEASAEKIKQDFAALQQLGKDAVAAFDIDTSDLAESRTTTGTSVDPLMNILINENIVNQQAQGGAGGGAAPKTKTQAQLEAEAKANLALIAGAGPTQMIGPSFSAQKSLDIMQEMKVLEAQGKTGTAEYESLLRSLNTNINIASGAALTSADKDAAWQWAMQNMNEDWAAGISTSELELMAAEDILRRKQEAAGISDLIKDSEQKKENEQQKAGGPKPEQQRQTVQSIAQQLLTLMQRVEPKIPQHILA